MILTRAVCSADAIAAVAGETVATVADEAAAVVDEIVVDYDSVVVVGGFYSSLDRLCDDFLVVAWVAIFLVVPGRRQRSV